jgi:hypothetical protein
MSYATAYLKKNGIDRATAKDMLTSPLGKFISYYVNSSKQIGITELLNAYDPNVSNTLRGELRTLTAIESLIVDISLYADGIDTTEPDKEVSDLQQPDLGFEQLKAPVNYK